MLIIKVCKNGDLVNINKYNLNFLNNSKSIVYLYTWTLENYTYKLYGSENGIAGNENKYDLPPPIDNKLYFNDLYIIKYNTNNNFTNLTLDEWNKFYNTLFGGFEDIEKDEDEVYSELSEHTSDRDFINDDDVDYFTTEEDEEDIEITGSDFSSEDEELVIEECKIEKNTTSTLEDDLEKTTLNDDLENISDSNQSDVSSIEITLSCTTDEDDDLNSIEIKID